jgi:hypothetical protein
LPSSDEKVRSSLASIITDKNKALMNAGRITTGSQMIFSVDDLHATRLTT